MGEQRGIADDDNMTRLDQLEAAMEQQQLWSTEEQAWLLAELRKAWARLAESEAWTPVDPSRIG